MKQQKVLVAVVAVFVLFIFASLVYADDGNYGQPFRRLQERINDNEIEIQNVYGEIATLHSLINGLSVRIEDLEEFIAGLDDLENLQETILLHKQEILALWGDIDELWCEISEPVPAMMAEGYGYFTYHDDPNSPGTEYSLGTFSERGQVKIFQFGQEDTTWGLQIIIVSPGIDLEGFMGLGNPPGAGNGLAVNILSASEDLVPGIYEHYVEDENAPYTWGDLVILPGYDSGELGNPEYISISGNDITITGVPQQELHISYPEVWVVEDPEDPDADEFLVSGEFTILFTPPTP